MPSTQVAPAVHGSLAHSFTLMRQSGPVKPGAHSHLNQFTPSTHLPPFKHGSGWQSSTSRRQFGPSKPSRQTQRYLPSAVFTQVAPFSQGLLVQAEGDAIWQAAPSQPGEQ
jgi:hypothetical protein